MPKTNKISTYFNGNSKDATQKVQEPKVHINEATLKVMGQAAQGLWLHGTGVHRGSGDVPIFWQPEPGGCPDPQLTGLTT